MYVFFVSHELFTLLLLFCLHTHQEFPNYLTNVLPLSWLFLPLSPKLVEWAVYISCFLVHTTIHASILCHLTNLFPTLLKLLLFLSSSIIVSPKSCSCSLSPLTFLHHENAVVTLFWNGHLPWLVWQKTLLALPLLAPELALPPCMSLNVHFPLSPAHGYPLLFSLLPWEPMHLHRFI